MRCATCKHARKNSGLVIPQVKQPYFCLRIDGHELADVLGGILGEFAKDQRCPSFESLPDYPDAYLAEDAESAEMVSEAYRQTMIDIKG